VLTFVMSTPLPCEVTLTLLLATPAVVLLSFTVPKIYELNKHEIDNAAQTGYQKVHPSLHLC